MSRDVGPTVAQTQAITRLICECEELGSDPVIWRRHLAKGVVRLIPDTVALLYELSAPSPKQLPGPEDPAGLSPVLIDHGWIDDSSKSAFDEYLQSGEAAANPLLAAIMQLEPGTLSTTAYEIEPDEAWRARAVSEYMGRARVCIDCITHAKRLPSGRTQVITLHRHLGRHAWTPSETALFLLLFELLHPKLDSLLAPVGEPSILDLPPRATAVLDAMFRGLSSKQIALERDLSVHTINEYSKLIHRHFGVQSRSELQTRFAGVNYRHQIEPLFGDHAEG